jgi:hypothetical protein
MKADIPLAERRRIEREQQAEIRAMLAPRHFATMREQMALDAVMHRLECEALIEAAPSIYAAMGRTAVPAAPAPAPVVMPEPAPPPAPMPVPRSGAPDMPFDLRFHLGLK